MKSPFTIMFNDTVRIVLYPDGDMHIITDGKYYKLTRDQTEVLYHSLQTIYEEGGESIENKRE